jgi:alpha-amylase/alpha-mannosidase (GH57 family)
VNAVFRERPLSDFIGFTASKNDAQEASRHLLHHLTHISSLIPHETGLIPLILDGENAWETFRDGGEAFLRALYSGIAAAPERLRSCTIEDYFTRNPPARNLTTLHTGSWISGNFDIWIGEDEENRAWDLLGQTRAFLQSRIDAADLAAEERERALTGSGGTDRIFPRIMTHCSTTSSASTSRTYTRSAASRPRRRSRRPSRACARRRSTRCRKA